MDLSKYSHCIIISSDYHKNEWVKKIPAAEIHTIDGNSSIITKLVDKIRSQRVYHNKIIQGDELLLLVDKRLNIIIEYINKRLNKFNVCVIEITIEQNIIPPLSLTSYWES